MPINSTNMAVAERNDAERPAPTSLLDLFVSFTLLALQGFGGVMAVVQRELVEKKRWLTPEEFVEDWAVAQVMPGPNAVNLSIIVGGRYFGVRGAIAAFFGILTVPLLLILIIGVVYAPYAHQVHVAHALRGMGAVAAGLILATGIRLIAALKRNVLGKLSCLILGAACFFSIVWLHLPLAYPLLLLGLIGGILAYRRLAP